jgi:hypothetical protein
VHGIALVLTYDPVVLEILPHGPSGSGEGPDWYTTGGHIVQPIRQLEPGQFGLEATWLIQFDGDTPLGTLADGDFEFYTLRCRLKSDTDSTRINLHEGYLPTKPGEAYPTLYDHHRLAISFHLRPGTITTPG